MPRPKKQQLKQRADGRYRCTFNGVSFYGRSSDEAIAARDEYKKAFEKGAKRDFNISVEEYSAKWLPVAKANVQANTYNDYARLLDILNHYIGKIQMRDVTATQIKEVYSTYFIGLSDSYIKLAKYIYRALFDSAVSDKICNSNPAREKTSKPHIGTYTGYRAITKEERWMIENLAKGNRMHVVAMVMLYTGIRPSEAKAINLDTAVDYNNSVIHIKEFIHLEGTNTYAINGKGKNKYSVRDVPLLTPLKNVLSGRSGMLITCADGKPLTKTGWRSAWESYKNEIETELNGMQKRWYKRTKEHRNILDSAEHLRQQGLKKEAEAKESEIPEWKSFNVVPYDLRHSFITWCRDNGVELHTVIDWAGHADATMVLKIYDEVGNDRRKAEAERLEKILLKGQNKGQE